MAEKQASEEKCALCGRSSSAVERLIKGSEGCICNTCIELCKIINDELERSEHTD